MNLKFCHYLFSPSNNYQPKKYYIYSRTYICLTTFVFHIGAILFVYVSELNIKFSSQICITCYNSIQINEKFILECSVMFGCFRLSSAVIRQWPIHSTHVIDTLEEIEHEAENVRLYMNYTKSQFITNTHEKILISGHTIKKPHTWI